MRCPRCKREMRALPAQPASTVYVCDDKACAMNDVIDPSVLR